MKYFLLAAACALGAWFWLVGGRQITESDVRALYSQEAAWLDAAKPQAMCDVFDDQYAGRVTTLTGEIKVFEVIDKAKSCASLVKFFEVISSLNAKLGGAVVTNSDVNIDKIEISGDKKTATVTVRTEIRIGTEKALMMKMTTGSVDTLVKRNGQVLRLAAESRLVMH